jgi:hypothetical protein
MMLNHMIRIPFVGLIIIQRSGLTKRGRFVVPLSRKHESAANARPVASNQSTRLPPDGSVTFQSAKHRRAGLLNLVQDQSFRWSISETFATQALKGQLCRHISACERR